MVLVFVLGSNNKNSNSVNKHILSCIVNNINLNVGDRITDFYKVSDKEANIEFDFSREDIVSIDENGLVGLKAGEVIVTLNVSNKNQSISESFIVKVYQKGYIVNLINVENCQLNKNLNTLYMFDTTCIFRVELYDALNNKMENLKFNTSVDSFNATIDKEWLNIILKADESCKIILDFYELNELFIINVELI